MQPDPDIEKIAVLIVVNCFRNTVLEQYHCEWPQFTDEKMKALMKEAVDRTYTALCGLLKPASTADFAALQDSLHGTPRPDARNGTARVSTRACSTIWTSRGR